MEEFNHFQEVIITVFKSKRRAAKEAAEQAARDELARQVEAREAADAQHPDAQALARGQGGHWGAASDVADGVRHERLTPEQRDRRAGEPLTDAQRAGFDALVQLANIQDGRRG